MTTVVAVAHNGTVHMAADSCTNVYERPIPGAARKILRLPAGTGHVLLGFTGHGGLPATLAHQLRIDAEPGPDQDANPWAHTIAVAATQIAVEAGLVEDAKLDGHLLLAWNGQLWTIVHGVAIPHPDGRAALGSGEGPAIGALDALLDTGTAPADAITRACLIGVARDRYSEPPITVEVLHPAHDQPSPNVTTGGGRPPTPQG